jgi:hypothetical protein
MTGFARVAVAFAACVAASGCLGPGAVHHTRLRYNEAYAVTNDEQLLLNIVRLRYAESPIFIDLPNITGQFEVAGGGSYVGPNQSVSSTFGYGGLSGRDTPTLSYHPREGREMAKSLLTPLTADLFILFNTGANIRHLLLMVVNDMNDVPNAPVAATVVPDVADDNSEFLHGLRLLTTLRERGAMEISIGTTDAEDDSSDPIPTTQVGGRDVLNAAKDGYVFRARGGDHLALLKREKGLVLRYRPAFVHSPEAYEIARIFHLAPGRTWYKIKSELAEEAYTTPTTPMAGDTLYLNMRSVLQIMIFLSKGVCVPEEHLESGVAPAVPGAGGHPYNWTRVTGGQFFVDSRKHRPRDAEVAVQYRGYWFFIRCDDVNSRAVLALMETLFSLQESDGKNVGPLLTLPLGG